MAIGRLFALPDYPIKVQFFAAKGKVYLHEFFRMAGGRRQKDTGDRGVVVTGYSLSYTQGTPHF